MRILFGIYVCEVEWKFWLGHTELFYMILLLLGTYFGADQQLNIQIEGNQY